MNQAILRISVRCARWRLALIRLRQLLDRSPDGRAVISGIGEAVDEVIGWLDDANEQLELCCHAIEQHNLDDLRHHYDACHISFNKATHRFWRDVASFERVGEIIRLARKHGNEWQIWAKPVRSAIRQSRSPVREVHDAIRRGWQNLVTQGGSLSVMVQAERVNVWEQKTK